MSSDTSSFEVTSRPMTFWMMIVCRTCLRRSSRVMFEVWSAASNSASVARLYCLLTRSTACSTSSSEALADSSRARSSRSFSLIRSPSTSFLITLTSVEAPGACDAATIRR